MGYTGHYPMKTTPITLNQEYAAKAGLQSVIDTDPIFALPVYTNADGDVMYAHQGGKSELEMLGMLDLVKNSILANMTYEE